MTNKSKIAKTFLRKLSDFGRNKSGQLALSFGLAAVPIMGATGIAVDYTRKVEAQAVTQAALDGAALAATAAHNSGEVKAVYEQAAQDFFDRNKPANLIGNPVVKVVVNYSKGEMVATIDASISTTMTKILGYDTIPLTNDHSGAVDDEGNPTGGAFGATISLPAFTVEHKGEIVFVMDYSGSMNRNPSGGGGEKKYITMRNEAARLVNALSQGKTSDYVKFGVVPFSSEVYATMKKKHWYGYTGDDLLASCSRDRKYPYNETAASPLYPFNRLHETRFGWVRYENSNQPWSRGFKRGRDNYRNNCRHYVRNNRNLEVQDLTGNHTDTYNKILSMKPYGGTHIAAGMEFGYHLLSPAEPFSQGVAYHSDDTEKAVILLTDGAQTTKAFGPGNSYNVTKGEKNLATLCTNMKANGIRILTVAYDLNNNATETRLRTCASSPDDYYDPDSKSELISSFSQITAKLARDMYLAK